MEHTHLSPHPTLFLVQPALEQVSVRHIFNIIIGIVKAYLTRVGSGPFLPNFWR